MSEAKQAWWSKAVLVGAIIAIVCLAIGPFGHRLGVFTFMPGLMLTAIATVLALLCFVVGLIGLIVVLVKGRTADRSNLVFGVVLSVVVLAAMGPFFLTDVPPIHNISTDTEDPPSFDLIVDLRGEGSNPLEYDASKLAQVQKEAYPEVKTLHLDEAPENVLVNATNVLSALDIEVINLDEEKGIVEGTATTRWFQFKDDVVVRVRVDPNGSGSIVDVRSVSRVGVSDLGVNAKRIRAILDGLGG